MNYLPHQQRVVDEKSELDAKIDKLTAFIDTTIFQSLPEAEQERLVRQLHHMGHYSAVIGERIEAFPRPALTEADALADLTGTPRPSTQHPV